jgi:hypothetical protein
MYPNHPSGVMPVEPLSNKHPFVWPNVLKKQLKTYLESLPTTGYHHPLSYVRVSIPFRFTETKRYMFQNNRFTVNLTTIMSNIMVEVAKEQNIRATVVSHEGDFFVTMWYEIV